MTSSVFHRSIQPFSVKPFQIAAFVSHPQGLLRGNNFLHSWPGNTVTMEFLHDSLIGKNTSHLMYTIDGISPSEIL